MYRKKQHFFRCLNTRSRQLWLKILPGAAHTRKKHTTIINSGGKFWKIHSNLHLPHTSIFLAGYHSPENRPSVDFINGFIFPTWHNSLSSFQCEIPEIFSFISYRASVLTPWCCYSFGKCRDSQRIRRMKFCHQRYRRRKTEQDGLIKRMENVPKSSEWKSLDSCQSFFPVLISHTRQRIKKSKTNAIKMPNENANWI